MNPDDNEPRPSRTDFLMRERVIGEKYRLGRLLGEGGMGAVYEAVHTKLGARVAVKLMNANIAQSKKAVTRFRREAKAMAAIRHPNVVAVMDADADEDGVPYLVMEFLDGESLSAVLARERTLPPDIAAGIAAQILAGLQVAHEQGVVHRDLKPPNLFVCQEQDGSLRIKILDFGISKYAADTSTDGLTIEGGLVGTPQYMSPEQARGDADVDHRADLYGVGVLLYRMVCGRHPFRKKPAEGLYDDIIEGEPTSPSALVPNLPDGLVSIIKRSMSNDREDRYANALEMRAAIFDTFPSLPRESMMPPSGASRLSGPSAARAFISRSSGSNQPQEMGLAPTEQASPAGHFHHTAPTSLMAPGRLPRFIVWLAAFLGLVGLGVTIQQALQSDEVVAPVQDPTERPVPPRAIAEVPLQFSLMRYLPREQVIEQHRPLAEYLGEQLERPIELVVVEDYGDLAGQIATGQLDFAALTPYSYVLASEQSTELQLLATPITSAGHSSYQGFILTRTNLPINDLEGLHDKVFCYVSESSTSGYVYPRALFRRAGIDPNRDFRAVRITGDHIASLRALHAGGCDGAAVYANAYHDAEDHGMSRDEFRVLATTDPIPYDAYVASPNIAPELAERAKRALLAVQPGNELSDRVMGSHTEFVGFTDVDDERYNVVREAESPTP